LSRNSSYSIKVRPPPPRYRHPSGSSLYVGTLGLLRKGIRRNIPPSWRKFFHLPECVSTFVLRAVVVCVTADTPARHMLAHHKQQPSHFPCMQCMVKKTSRTYECLTHSLTHTHTHTRHHAVATALISRTYHLFLLHLYLFAS